MKRKKTDTKWKPLTGNKHVGALISKVPQNLRKLVNNAEKRKIKTREGTVSIARLVTKPYYAYNGRRVISEEKFFTVKKHGEKPWITRVSKYHDATLASDATLKEKHARLYNQTLSNVFAWGGRIPKKHKIWIKHSIEPVTRANVKTLSEKTRLENVKTKASMKEVKKGMWNIIHMESKPLKRRRGRK